MVNSWGRFASLNFEQKWLRPSELLTLAAKKGKKTLKIVKNPQKYVVSTIETPRQEWLNIPSKGSTIRTLETPCFLKGLYL